MNSDKELMKTEGTISLAYQDFWNWFQENSNDFLSMVKTGNRVEKDFFQKLSSKLEEITEGIFFLVGMIDENTAELTFTPDGVVKNVVFVEDIVQAAPVMNGWKFIALKQAFDLEDCNVQMQGYSFDKETLTFYSNDHLEYPDEIDITIIHKNYKEGNKEIISGGAYIFLDNYLGELNFINTIDHLDVIGPAQVKKEPVPASKLKDFLIWREKEFLEKYGGIRHNTESDQYTTMEGILENGKPIIALMNATLLDWDRKASHPWILRIGITYEGHYKTGMPDDKTHDLLNAFEEKISDKLPDHEGFLNIGRQTSDNIREIYYACKDFRKPSKILYQLNISYKGKVDFMFDIYKDKYWQTFDHLMVNR
ncbi:MAG: DUF695 domain-containing protein [Chitinophagaceae bacterium]